jgi:hypothetical protein
VSIGLGFLVWGIIAARYLWPVLRQRSRVWAFNLRGSADLLHAYYLRRVGIGIEPGQLGAAYFYPTVVVPLLLTTHVLVFRLLLRGDRSAVPG